MPFQEGAIYVTPDGRRFRAQLDKRHYGADRSWTLVPARHDRGGDGDDAGLFRDALEQMLFLDRGHIMRMDFDNAKLVVDTGWTAADLRPEI